MRQRQRFAALTLAVVLSACSTGSNDAGVSRTRSLSASSSETAQASTTVSSRSVATEPLATDTPAVTRALQTLIDRYDAAVQSILRDPRVAADRASAPVRAYLVLFPPTSGFAEGALRFWTQEADRGRFYRPGPGGQLTKSTVMTVTSSDPDNATFAICAVHSIEVTDRSGAVVEAQGGRSAVSASAVRVDGTWMLRDLTQEPATACPGPAGH